MIFNPFVAKKYVSLLLTGTIPVVTVLTTLMITKNDVTWLVVNLIISLMLSMIISFALLKNPFSSMLESNNIGVIDINSTGVIRMLNMKLMNPDIEIYDNGKIVKDVFDRDTVSSIFAPLEDGDYAVKEGNIYFKMPLEDFNKERFGLYGRPIIMYNSSIGRVIGKDMIAEGEKDIFANHMILYATRLHEQSHALMRDFARTVMDLFKPSGMGNLIKSPFFWIIIIIVIGLMGMLFAPSIMDQINSLSGGISQATNTAMGGTPGVR
jgi:hypothetical protein